MKNSPQANGFVLHETIMAMALTGVLVVAIAQLLTMVVQQQRRSRQYAVAVREAGNLMEDLVSRSWADTTAEKLDSVDVSPACARCLPDASLAVEVVDEGQDVRRIGLQIQWLRPSGTRGDPVRLVGWKFRNEEDAR